jgi:hypothetical protein
MPLSSTCQWKAAWNSDPSSVCDHLDSERKSLKRVVDELDRCFLVESVVE